MNSLKLQSIGWNNYLLQQLSFEEVALLGDKIHAFRITAIHRNRIEAIGEVGARDLMCPQFLQPVSQHLAVGDWVLVKPFEEHLSISRVITPKNRIERLQGNHKQVIAANLDYLWIVTSANHDFNLKRIQRYLALAYEFEIEPVVIVTKTDLCNEIDGKSAWDFIDQVKSLNVNLVHGVSVTDSTSLEGLQDYFKVGNTIALLGSSGVGKSTLVNALSSSHQAIQSIRDSDNKGKHTTTHRQLFFTDNQVAIIDTPGMRELHLFKSDTGLEKTFEEIVTLMSRCKFSNCQHESEPGCAVIEALKTGGILQTHFDNYKKLLKEDEFIKRKELGSHAEKAHDRAFFKMIDQHRKTKW